MNKIKKTIIIILCIIIVLLIPVIILLKNNSNGDTLFMNKKIEEQESADIPEDILNISDYFIAKDCIQNYLDIANNQNSIYYDKQEDGNQKYNEKVHKDTLYTVLNEKFITEKNITAQNIFNYVKIYNTKQRFYPTSITVLSKGEVSTLKVSGIVQDLNYKNAQEVYFIVSFYTLDDTFSIRPLDKTLFEKYEEKDSINKIENKEYNICTLDQITDEKIAIEIFEAYRFFTLANPKLTFDKMSEEYRNKRFGTYENYVQYVKENYNEFLNIIPKRFLSTYTGKYTQYVLQDQYNNNYIFDTVDALNYYVSLDTYTIDGEKFNSTYESADDSKKVQMNIGKFFDMINRHDYRTSYACLSDSFKKENAKSEQEFRNTIKSNLFAFNKYKVEELKNIGTSTYVCKVYVENKIDAKFSGVYMTIVMQLLENKNFVMSYSFE